MVIKTFSRLSKRDLFQDGTVSSHLPRQNSSVSRHPVWICGSGDEVDCLYLIEYAVLMKLISASDSIPTEKEDINALKTGLPGKLDIFLVR